MTDYEAAARVRLMCQQIARTLGHEEKPDVTDDSVSWTYVDGRIRIYDHEFWIDLSAKNSAGHYARALTVGGLTAKVDESLLRVHLDYIKSLYIMSYFVPSAGTTEKESLPCPN